jgi:hypothetical protein
MSGFDSLIIGSSDPKVKAVLKSPQIRAWTSFIEAVTATGRVLTPEIIFKGKYLQAQWFLNEFKESANWYFIISPNGWTNHYIGYSWLVYVYNPQTKPVNPLDTRLIIMDGHGSLSTDDFMAFCFLNNIYCCYFPAHCSHGMQPLDNGLMDYGRRVLRAGSRRQASLRKTDAVGVRENPSSGPAKSGKPLREWIRIHSSRLFPSRSTRSCNCLSFFFY